MFKRIFAIITLVCMVSLMICACEAKEKISAGEAVEIVKNDLGVDDAALGQPHIHSGTYKKTPCFNIYVTVNGVSYEYVISIYGDILHKNTGSEHSH